MEIRLDRKSPTPIHLQIAHRIRDLILRGVLPERGRLPPTRKLARAIGVNRSTVVQAYEKLWAEGLVESHVGRGTVVRPTTGRESIAVSPPPWGMLFASRAETLELELRELSRLFDRDDLISLAAGLPAPDLYPLEEITELTREVLTEEGRSLLQWCTLQGYAPLRRLLAEREGLSPGEILVLSGSTQGLFLLSRTLIEPGDFVVVEAPTYLGALQAFRAAGARLVGVSVDEDGMDLRMLENILSRTQPKFIYTLPTFQNPTGATMSLDRRRGLLELAYRYRTPIVEDDPYRLLRYEGEPLPSLKDLDTHGYVIHLSTFTKVLFPGFRIGWLAAPRRLIEQLTPAKQILDIFTNSLGQAVVDRFLRRGSLERHLEKVRTEYRVRRDVMAKALRRRCPGLAFSVPNGGYYIWCQLPREIAARDLLRETLRERVSFLTGEVFYPDGRGHDRVRLSFTSQPAGVIQEGVGRIGTALRRLKRAGTVKSTEGESLARPIV